MTIPPDFMARPESDYVHRDKALIPLGDSIGCQWGEYRVRGRGFTPDEITAISTGKYFTGALVISDDIHADLTKAWEV